jgi:hypothetical protein
MMGRLRRIAAGLGWIAAGGLSVPEVAGAQSVVVDGPPGQVLPGVTPRLVVRMQGFGAARPFLVRLQVGDGPDLAIAALVVDTAFLTTDSTVTVQVTRPLPSDGTVYWRALVAAAGGTTATSAVTGPRRVPPWLVLVAPNSPAGDVFDIRRPLFVWQGAEIAAETGGWRYDIEITLNNRPAQSATELRDTTYRAFTDLEANAFYRWNVRAYLRTGESIRVASRATFFIDDPPIPSATLFYQNFPNPFPSPVAFATCFWFDVGPDRSRVSLDVLDLRGNLVRTIIPGSDGIAEFDAGRYGRGAPGAGSNCDNRFVWDGTASDGRPVAPGVYLARFRSGNEAPLFRRMVFRGR